MTIPVKIEFGNHVVHAQMPALPRSGDRIDTAFPASIGPDRLQLMVDKVYFHQLEPFEGRECPHPFFVVVTTTDAPEGAQHNLEVFKKLWGAEVSKHVP